MKTTVRIPPRASPRTDPRIRPRTGPRTGPRTVATLCLALATTASTATAVTTAQEDAPPPQSDETSAATVITAPPPRADESPSPAFMEQVYAASETGKRLYEEQRYADALPYLVAASQYGFKLPQAALGDIYLHGRGDVPRDNQTGIGWLGTAAQPPTTTQIEEYYDSVLAQLSEAQASTARGVVARYRARFAGSEHGLACQLFGTVIEDLRCGFLDDPEFAAQVDQTDQGYFEDHGDVEEMVVTAPIVSAPGPEPGEMPSGQFIAGVYDAMNRGSQLYRDGRYKEALPFLLVAAKRGFKWAQASAADIYLYGRGGVPVDLETGIGWLGVAAQPKTNNAILRFFKDSKDRLPERYSDAAVQTIVSDYRNRFGHRAHRVTCRFDADQGTAWSFNFKRLRCRFMDEATQCRGISLLDGEARSEWNCEPVRGSSNRTAPTY